MPQRVRAVTFDYWDTLVDDRGLHHERVALRHRAVAELLREYQCILTDEQLEELYGRAGREAMRWWADDQRGYTTDERIRWMLAQVEVEPPPDCRHVAATVRAVDDALLQHPPPLLDGVRELLAELTTRVRLGVISDTGFASGDAQDRLLEHHGIREHFADTTYSMDVGFPKPRPAIFRAALDALAVDPAEVIHIGDIERTDVRGALGMGMRAVRLDVFRDGGESEAEFVATSYEELAAYLLGEIGHR
jgi:putative hydrolase of the HAD superfamily